MRRKKTTGYWPLSYNRQSVSKHPFYLISLLLTSLMPPCLNLPIFAMPRQQEDRMQQQQGYHYPPPHGMPPGPPHGALAPGAHMRPSQARRPSQYGGIKDAEICDKEIQRFVMATPVPPVIIRMISRGVYQGASGASMASSWQLQGLR